MAIHMNINFGVKPRELSLPFGSQLDIDVKIGPMRDEMTVGVQYFPDFIKAIFDANLLLVQAQISINILAQRLIVNTDPLVVANIDAMTLGDLDIDQNITYNSIE